ncbi:MAG: hypothetical protein N2B06_00700 [Clostridium sp.]
MGKLATVVVLTKKPSTSISGGSSLCLLSNRAAKESGLTKASLDMEMLLRDIKLC